MEENLAKFWRNQSGHFIFMGNDAWSMVGKFRFGNVDVRKNDSHVLFNPMMVKVLVSVSYNVPNWQVDLLLAVIKS